MIPVAPFGGLIEVTVACEKSGTALVVNLEVTGALRALPLRSVTPAMVSV